MLTRGQRAKRRLADEQEQDAPGASSMTSSSSGTSSAAVKRARTAEPAAAAATPAQTLFTSLFPTTLYASSLASAAASPAFSPPVASGSGTSSKGKGKVVADEDNNEYEFNAEKGFDEDGNADEETRDAMETFANVVPEEDETTLPFFTLEDVDIARAVYDGIDQMALTDAARAADATEAFQGLGIFPPTLSSPAGSSTSSTAPAFPVWTRQPSTSTSPAETASFGASSTTSSASPSSTPRTLHLDDTTWEDVALQVLAMAEITGVASPEELGRVPSAYQGSGVVQWNWSTLEEPKGKPMSPENHSWTVDEARDLGFDAPDVSVMDTSTRLYTNRKTGKKPMQKDAFILRVFNFLQMWYEKRARLELGNQTTLLQGKELEGLWAGLFDGATHEWAQHFDGAERELLPLLHKLYGAANYDRLRHARIQKIVVSIELDFGGGKGAYGGTVTLEKLENQTWRQASALLQTYSMAAKLTMGFRAAMGIVANARLFHFFNGSSCPDLAASFLRFTDLCYGITSIKRISKWSCQTLSLDEMAQDSPEAYRYMLHCLRLPHIAPYMRDVLPSLAFQESYELQDILAAAQAAYTGVAAVLKRAWDKKAWADPETRLAKSAITRVARNKGTLSKRVKAGLDKMNEENRNRWARGKAASDKQVAGQRLTPTELKDASEYKRKKGRCSVYQARIKAAFDKQATGELCTPAELRDASAHKQRQKTQNDRTARLQAAYDKQVAGEEDLTPAELKDAAAHSRQLKGRRERSRRRRRQAAKTGRYSAPAKLEDTAGQQEDGQGGAYEAGSSGLQTKTVVLKFQNQVLGSVSFRA